LSGVKKIVAVIVIAVAAASIWHLHSKAAEARREASYREALAPFQRDLHAGMTREDVRSYLDSKKIRWYPVGAGGAWSYEINIGEEPSYNPFCESWTVYVAMDFASVGNETPEPDPLPGDTLNEIRIRKVETCL
jgi:hypothetical protein